MLEAERRRIILGLLHERVVIGIPELAEMLQVSSITVRRDVNLMAAQGLLRRIRGGAEALASERKFEPQPALMIRRETSFLTKRAIARAAVRLMTDGDAVIVNGGSTTYAMTEFLHERSLSILSNSLAFAAALIASRNRIVIPGGTVYREENLVLAFDEDSSVTRFPGRTLFTSCYGLNRQGLMEADPLVMQAEMQLFRHADHIIVLADSSKLRLRSSAVVAPLARVSVIITDTEAAADDVRFFRKSGIEVIVVSAQSNSDTTNEHRPPTSRERALRHIDFARATKEAE